MRKSYIYIVLLFNLFQQIDLKGQNLIPNGDFEQYWGCPNFVGQIDSAKFWFQATLGTPEYFNQCAPNVQGGVHIPNTAAGFQHAHSGGAFAGIWCMYGTDTAREYIEVPIQSPTNSLIYNLCYHFEMYINLGNISYYSSDNIGVYFSDTIITWYSLSSLSNLPFSPQISNTPGNFPDTLNWTLVSGDYIAHGGESYLIIGNFNDNLSTDTLNVNSSSNFPIIYFNIDDVSLTLCGEGITNYNDVPAINIFPNPATSQLTININNNEPAEITLYDITSRKIMEQRFVNTATLNTEQLAKGVYLYEVRNKKGVLKNGKLIKE